MLLCAAGRLRNSGFRLGRCRHLQHRGGLLRRLGDLQLRGVRPFLSDKFDITKHKRYKELSDFDKKNAFDVERYLKHELRLRMDEEFDCYEVDVSEESTA